MSLVSQFHGIICKQFKVLLYVIAILSQQFIDLVVVVPEQVAYDWHTEDMRP